MDNVINMSIIEYVNYLYREGGVDNILETIRSQFFEVKQLFKDSGNTILKIKYMEHNKIWTKWARQSRGVIVRLDPISNTFVCDKMMLIRGAEVLTNVHIKADITETQDIVNFKERSFLDDSQIDTIERLLNLQPIDAFMSFKNDGSLLAISLYPVGSSAGDFYTQLISGNGDDFSRGILELSQIMNLPFVPIISSQGTVFLGEDMKDYMVSAILIGSCDITHDQVIEIAQTCTPIKALFEFGRTFFKKLEIFYGSTHQINGSMTLSFEAICKNRTACWPTSRIHTELAISYPFTDLRFLGCAFNVGSDVGIYKAHYQLSDECVQCNFDQPMFWKINHAIQVEEMMKDLSRVISGEISSHNYFELHPYNNITPPKNLHIDFEGWIMYRELSDGTLDYSKIKSEEYYVSHKFKEQNIPKLVSIAMGGTNAFPLATVVNDFFVDLNEKLYSVLTELKKVLELENSELINGLPEKAVVSFSKQRYDTKIKMLINASVTWNVVCFNMFKSVFNGVKKSDECDSTLKAIVMNSKPWENADLIKTNIDILVAKCITPKNKKDVKQKETNCIGELFGHMVETHID